MEATTMLIGRSIPRMDSPQKVRGQTRYTDDLHVPGMLHARLVTAPYAHARILGVETSQAVSLPGVVAVITGRDLFPEGPEPAERARWLGELLVAFARSHERRSAGSRQVTQERAEIVEWQAGNAHGSGFLVFFQQIRLCGLSHRDRTRAAQLKKATQSVEDKTERNHAGRREPRHGNGACHFLPEPPAGAGSLLCRP
uniref:Aldehyde oxidase/xanthine dehydrogenase a/b hammerhead domain-containing protein n=1 Tax=Agrobacterium albertimagni TaxID=147266 RepID=A0A7C1NYS1_9HYPH